VSNAIWIKDPLAILAEESQRGIVVNGSKIVECVPAGQEPRTPVGRVFEAGHHVIIPGLINTHHHFYQTLTRAFGPSLDKELFDWLQTLYPVWRGLTPDRLRLATRVALAELLLSGCTMTVDHHYIFPAGLERAIDIQVEEASRLGMRVMLTRGSMDLSVEDGGLPPPEVVQTADAILADCQRLVSIYHEPDPGAMVQIALAPCSPFSVSEHLMKESRHLADELDVRLHTHLAETRDETEYCLATHQCRPLDYLERLGWLDARVWLAHGIWFENEEIRRLGRAGIGIAHCAGSNMILASGFCRTRELEEAGCAVGLAVDGSASNDASNMMQEVRQAFLLNRVSPHHYRISHRDVLRWATAGSARCLGREDIGRIEMGQEADLAFFSLDEFRFSGAGDPLAALVICGAHRADRVMVAGRWVVEEGTIPGFDLVALRRAHQAAAEEIQFRRV
jgi:8-oxoguanine deaminase